MTTHRRLLYRIIAESLGCFQKKEKKERKKVFRGDPAYTGSQERAEISSFQVNFTSF